MSGLPYPILSCVRGLEDRSLLTCDPPSKTIEEADFSEIDLCGSLQGKPVILRQSWSDDKALRKQQCEYVSPRKHTMGKCLSKLNVISAASISNIEPV